MKAKLENAENIKINCLFVKIDNTVYSRDMKQVFTNLQEMLQFARTKNTAITLFKIALRKQISNIKSKLVEFSSENYKTVRYGKVGRYTPQYFENEFFSIEIIPSVIKQYSHETKPENQKIKINTILNKTNIKKQMYKIAAHG